MLTSTRIRFFCWLHAFAVDLTNWSRLKMHQAMSDNTARLAGLEEALPPVEVAPPEDPGITRRDALDKLYSPEINSFKAFNQDWYGS